MGTHLLWHPYFFGASPGECLTLVVACPIVCQSSTLHPSRAHRSICPRPAPARSVPSCRCSSPSPSRPPSSRPPLPCFVARPPSLGPRRSDSHRTQAPFALRPPSRSDPLCVLGRPLIARTPIARTPIAQTSDPHRSDPPRRSDPVASLAPIFSGSQSSDPVARNPFAWTAIAQTPLLGPPSLSCPPPCLLDPVAWAHLLGLICLGSLVACAFACCRPRVSCVW